MASINKVSCGYSNDFPCPSMTCPDMTYPDMGKIWELNTINLIVKKMFLLGIDRQKFRDLPNCCLSRKKHYFKS